MKGAVEMLIPIGVVIVAMVGTAGCQMSLRTTIGVEKTLMTVESAVSLMYLYPRLYATGKTTRQADKKSLLDKEF